jgi:hypothetical protein
MIYRGHSAKSQTPATGLPPRREYGGAFLLTPKICRRESRAKDLDSPSTRPLLLQVFRLEMVLMRVPSLAVS